MAAEPRDPASVPAPLPSANHPSPGWKLTLPPELLEAVAERVAELLADRAGPGPEQWIGVELAAAHLDCGPARVYALVSARRIPHERDGSRLLFRRSDLDEWVRRGGGKRP